MDKDNQKNRKKDTKGDIMPFLLLVLTFCAVSVIHFLPVFGSIFLVYCAALWYFGIKENNVELVQGVEKEIEVKKTSHRFEENRLGVNLCAAKVVIKNRLTDISSLASHLLAPPPPTKHSLIITLTPRLLQSPAK